uniref:Uncharacterized protein n=2 Tax=Ciona intestinalis TaxID=7719 RepID=F6XEB2_CIOIN
MRIVVGIIIVCLISQSFGRQKLKRQKWWRIKCGQQKRRRTPATPTTVTQLVCVLYQARYSIKLHQTRNSPVRGYNQMKLTEDEDFERTLNKLE